MQVRFPTIAKIVAGMIFLGIGAQMASNLMRRLNPSRPDRAPTVQLPGQLTAVFDAFKYVHHEDGRTKYILTAAKDQVFGDGHHDLTDVNLQIFDPKGETSGKVTSQHCRYEQDKSHVQFEG